MWSFIGKVCLLCYPICSCETPQAEILTFPRGILFQIKVIKNWSAQITLVKNNSLIQEENTSAYPVVCDREEKNGLPVSKHFADVVERVLSCHLQFL